MFPVKTATAVTSRPPYNAEGAPGFFTAGNAVAGIPATVPGEHWFNMTQEELLNVIRAAGLVPSATDDTQLAQAIAALIAAQAVTVAPASTTEAGIVERATPEEALAGVDAERYVCPADMAAATAGTVRAYTRQQYAAPVLRAGASGSQAVDCDLHQTLAITATGVLAFAAPTHMALGKTVTLQIDAAAAQAITWDAAWKGSSSHVLPTSTLAAGKCLLLSFWCAGVAMLLVGVVEEV